MRTLLPLLILLGAASAANAEVRAVCAPAPAAHARCDTLIVTNRTAPGGIAGYTAGQLRDAYKITAEGSISTVVAVVSAFGYNNAEADLNVYRTQFGLPACTTANGCFKKLNQKGRQKHYPFQNIGWAEEQALDLDMASAMCPKCSLWLLEAKTNSMLNLANTVRTAARLGAHAIANAYGGNGRPGRRVQNAYHQPGIAVTASAGSFNVFPASSNYVIAVGGTHLVPADNARGWLETGFGTGACTTFDKPDWQTDAGCAKRTVVDVAAVADPATGVAAYGPQSSGVSAWLTFGGTSVGAALIAGVYGANGGTVEYASDLYAHPEALFDIVSGPGGSCSPSYLCNAQAGYDGPTGMGTPNGTAAFGEP